MASNTRGPMRLRLIPSPDYRGGYLAPLLEPPMRGGPAALIASMV